MNKFKNKQQQREWEKNIKKDVEKFIMEVAGVKQTGKTECKHFWDDVYKGSTLIGKRCTLCNMFEKEE